MNISIKKVLLPLTFFMFGLELQADWLGRRVSGKQKTNQADIINQLALDVQIAALNLIFAQDNLTDLKSFISQADNKKFNWNESYFALPWQNIKSTPLMAATVYGAVQCIEYLLHENIITNLTATSSHGYTALNYAENPSKKNADKKDSYQKITTLLKEALLQTDKSIRLFVTPDNLRIIQEKFKTELQNALNNEKQKLQQVEQNESKSQYLPMWTGSLNITISELEKYIDVPALYVYIYVIGQNGFIEIPEFTFDIHNNSKTIVIPSTFTNKLSPKVVAEIRTISQKIKKFPDLASVQNTKTIKITISPVPTLVGDSLFNALSTASNQLKSPFIIKELNFNDLATTTELNIKDFLK